MQVYGKREVYGGICGYRGDLIYEVYAVIYPRKYEN